MNRMPVTSSNVKSVGYDRKELTLEVEFISGALYQYSNVPPIVWQEFQRRKRSNESIGKYLNGNVKGTYNYQKMN